MCLKLYGFCFLVLIVFNVSTSHKTSSNEKIIDATRTRIREELERFHPVQEVLKNANINVTVIFKHTHKQNGTPVQTDSFILRPLDIGKHDPKVPQLLENLSQEDFQKIWDLARAINMSAVGSQEGYLEDGSLLSKKVMAEDFQTLLEDGISQIVIKEAKEDLKDTTDDDFEDFVDMLKKYETPVDIEKTLYNENGEVIKVDRQEFKPRKVKIIDGDMATHKQLNVAEALKRAFVLKEDGNDRAHLLCKYLNIQYPRFKFQAIIGNGHHFMAYDEWVKMELEGEIYFIFAYKKE